MLVHSLFIIAGLGLLGLGAERFIAGASSIAVRLRISPLITGLVIVGFATSAPELIVGTIAAWKGNFGLVVGNVVGSNIANVSLVLGAGACLLPIAVRSGALKLEYMLLLASFLLGFVLMADGWLGRGDGLLLLGGLVLVMGFMIHRGRQPASEDAFVAELSETRKTLLPLPRGLLLLVAGLLLLLAGAELLVRGAAWIAASLGVSELVIGLTVVAVGTSLPELAACIVSSLKRQAELAVGNVIGSNIFNVLGVLGASALVRPGGFGTEALWRDFPVMLFLTLMMGFFVFLLGGNRISRWEGGILLGCFIAYQYSLFLSEGEGG